MNEESTQTALAAVFRGTGKPLSMEEISLPRLAEGEVLVRVLACTLCGSDLHTYRGERETPLPTILGHEILGEIVEFGAGRSPEDQGGQRLVPGDRISWSVAASCGGCFFCSREIPQKCESLIKYGHEVLLAPHQLSGGLAESCHLVAGTAMVRVPEALPDRVACPANCATATVAAALRVGMNGGKIETALVQGAGMLGLTACAMLRSRGVEVVIATDVSEARLARVEEFGATHAVNVAESGAHSELVAELTGGRGVDLALEMSGSLAAVRDGLAALRIGGRQVLVGSVFPGDAVAVDPERVVRRMLRIEGVHNYRPRDLVDAVAFLGEHPGAFPFESLVEGDYALENVEEAFAEAIRSGAPRIMVRGSKN